MEVSLTENERECAMILAKIFQGGTETLISPLAEMTSAGMKQNPDEFEASMRMMEHYQVIVEPIRSASGKCEYAIITPRAVVFAREIEKETNKAGEPRDIVAQVTEKARKHPVAAWAVILLIVATTILTFINQVLQLLKHIGWI